MVIKKTKIFLLLLLLLSIGSIGNAQTKKTMNSSAFKSSLNKGENKLIHYKTLTITPVNLFIQDKPWNDRSASIQLELNIEEGTKKFHTFLWYFEKGKDQAINYPLAWGNYVFSMEIKDQETVQLVVDTLNLGTPFFINFGENAIIGDLKINFKEVTDVMDAPSLDGAPSDAESYAEYDLVLSSNKEQKTLSFNSLNFYNKTEMSLEWNEYKIIVLYTDLNSLKLMVNKRSGVK
ncbi:MAG: hypothetical protein K8R85_15545 [Bacteroidetes bacterium]|nr:hypothetical protein [Bacteroidota bacterium]